MDMVQNNLPTVFETVVHMLADAAKQKPDNVALICNGQSLNYLEYSRCVFGFAKELENLGVTGNRVAIICGNSIEIAIATLAGYAARAQVVPINPIYTARELSIILKDAEPNVVIYDNESASAIENVLLNLDILNSIKVGKYGMLLDTWREDKSAISTGFLPNPNDLSVLQYTGGTTGKPKGVNITHGQMSINISQRECSIPTRPDNELVLCVMPLFHVFATSMCLHLSLYCRGTLVILKNYHPADTLKALENHKITLFPAGPTVFNGLLSYNEFTNTDFSALRRCVSGSAPLAAETLNSWQQLTNCPILEGYGQTEGGPVVTMFKESENPIPGSVGKPLPHTNMQIVDVETGNEILGPGEIGEIRVKGPQIMSGYRNRPEETALALRSGWLYTGDIGEFDAKGYFYIRDRKKDMVIVGGYNVYPREIDEVLYSHQSIIEAASIGIPDAYRGEVIYSYLVLKNGEKATSEEFEIYCKDNLAKYKIPVKFIFVDEIPKTNVGKVDKSALRKLYRNN